MKKIFYKALVTLNLFNVTSIKAQDVNPFTGTLNYNTNLMTIPNTRGANMPISIGYNSNGIPVMQSSSEVGLGWDLAIGGSIYRSVNGFPDDIEGLRANYEKIDFLPEKGALLGATNADILISKRNLDTLEFYYPNYDSYTVIGPGLGGNMTPLMLNYLAFTRDEFGGLAYDAFTSGNNWKQPQFIFNGDFNDTLVSRHYPEHLNSSSTYKLPKDVIPGACYNDATSYYGRRGDGVTTPTPCVENYNLTTNRLATSNYVEYTMGSYGISAFKITNSAGYVYRYDLPVYSLSNNTYNYPLNNDYSLQRYTTDGGYDTKIQSTDGKFSYLIHQYPNPPATPSNTFVTEIKESNIYANEWKLTSITGPDYVDANSNGLIDEGDKGYWVKFDYKLWSNNFSRRYPAYGFDYVSDIDDYTKHYAVNDPQKRNGKIATASVSKEEVYYLNSIQTPSHKSILIRDVREDESGVNDGFDSGLRDSVKINQLGVTNSWHGNLFDEGGSSQTLGYGTYTNTISRTVQLGKVDMVYLNFHDLQLSICNPGSGYTSDKMHIYAGPDNTYPHISFTHNSITYTSPFSTDATYPYTPRDVNGNALPMNVDVAINNYTASTITFSVNKVTHVNGHLTYTGNSNYNVEWNATGKKTPELFIKRILLYDNATFSSTLTMPAVTSLTTNITGYDLSTTTNTNTSTLFYNETWYQANQTTLKNNSLKGVFFEQDYSLAKKYHNNINGVPDIRLNRLVNQATVNTGLTFGNPTQGTGKLTLNKIITTELGGIQMNPSLIYDYNKTDANDNPDYNPLKIDYWGYYKSDASSLGYYGYTNSISKDYTDAWSLRKITSPTGGIMEFEYESNRYSKVLTGTGGFRGSSRIYPIVNTSTCTSCPFNLYLEEGTNKPADLDEVYCSSPPQGVTCELFLPVTSDVNYNYNSNNQLINYFGALTYSSSASLPIIVTNIEKQADAILGDGNPVYTSTTAVGSVTENFITPDALMYSGNGFVKFNMPIGYEVFGGGARIKKIINKNGAQDTYTTLYEYENGAVQNEADRFVYPRYKYQKHVVDFTMPQKLSAGSDKFELSASLGYSKVKIKNLGQVNASKGWTELSYINSDVSSLGENIDNMKVNLGPKTVFTHSATISSYTCSREDTIMGVEYINKYSPFWGLLIEKKVYDVNSNITSKDVYEYENTEQGALVENFVFGIERVRPAAYPGQTHVWYPDYFCFCCNFPDSIGYPSPCLVFNPYRTSYQVSIKRQYPVTIKRVTSYYMGSKIIMEPLRRDEVTGEILVTRYTSENNSSSLIIKKPSFRISEFEAMGPKSINSSWSNVLGAEAYYYSSVDTTLTTTSGASSNFLGALSNVYTKSALVRSYNSGTNTYTNTSNTLPNWYKKSSYNWAGAVGSIDDYGLYKKTELTSNPFNFSSPSSSNSKWRFSGEVSLMDEYEHILESRSFNNKFSAVKYDLNAKFPISVISNCNYLSFTYSGFENSLTGTTDGEVNVPSTGTVMIAPGTGSLDAHSGKNIVQVSSGGMGPNYAVGYNGTGSNGEELGLLRNRIYRASVWVNVTSSTNANLVMNLNGTSGGSTINQTVTMNINDSKAITIGNWKLLSVDLKVPADYTSTGGSSNKLTTYLEVSSGGSLAWFDDFQLHPIESTVNSKVYEAVTGRILADIDAEGYARKYTYDAAGRVVEIYQEIPGVGLKLIKHNSWNLYRGTN